MTEFRKPANQNTQIRISIGGSVGPASAIGQDIQVTAHNVIGGSVTQGASVDSTDQEKFLKLIQDLQVQVSQLENDFGTDDTKYIVDRLETVAQLSTSENPPVDQIKSDLQTVREIVEETAATGAAVAPLLPLIQQAWNLFLHFFRI